jgi:hypothetical protein
VRLKSLLPAWMPWIRKRFKLSAAIEKQLLSIRPRQMDRRLAAKKNQQRRRIYSLPVQDYEASQCPCYKQGVAERHMMGCGDLARDSFL